jgi:Rod binding domain-containing protein
MDMDATTSGMTAIQSAQIRTPAATGSKAQITAKAQEFEGVFITQMLGQMFEGLSTDGPFGGGQGEQMFRSLMLDEYGKQIAKQGGIGVADSVTRELLKHQEMAQAAANNAATGSAAPEVTKQ